ncbi:hypothetical protein [Pseudomonas asiatica]|uniref:hypothetical protein n=1 Tax=Pseudomonas asiatica TaxID=2219225 RepID=UPI0010C008AA|nr:hypothetical protein [Pseudomonas asiatica]
MKNRVMAVAADTKDLLGVSPATAEEILSNCRAQIELASEQQREPNQLLEFHNSGHCGDIVTPTTTTLPPEENALDTP